MTQLKDYLGHPVSRDYFVSKKRLRSQLRPPGFVVDASAAAARFGYRSHKSSQTDAKVDEDSEIGNDFLFKTPAGKRDLETKVLELDRAVKMSKHQQRLADREEVYG